ncbi:hypothetical protein RCH12_000458 [Cryobacterium sp. MP_3.1]|uniref:hypothetical protein n=1 Tax=Cryobacterium sp. MP_3.1 TaxID=3071711 RepID=UPI002DF8AF63|nr:hypothetical protein [Cryobacterium sp. MP_3.1]
MEKGTNDFVSGHGPTAIIGWDSNNTNKSTVITGVSIRSETGWSNSTGGYQYIAWAPHNA